MQRSMVRSETTENLQNRLPRTIEGATQRYLESYERNFRGPRDEMLRLKSLADASILHMRRKTPKFYEDHLPTLINQAASALLACDTQSNTGSRKFHETHKNFLRVLDELKKSQPDGEVNFQTEVARVHEKETLLRRHLAIRTKINELEATEIDCDEMGTDEMDAHYNKIFFELDKLKSELKKVSKLIAKMEGEDLDSSAEFKLLIPDGSALARLTTSQQKNLESQIVSYLKQNENKKKSMYVDKSIIDGMIAKLNIAQLTSVEINDLSKDALDAYKQHFRNIENERRMEFYDSLLKNENLKPKEGLILKSHDDVPEDVKRRLDASEHRYKRQMEECYEKFAKMQPENVDENASADVIEDDDESSNDAAEVSRIMEENSFLFKRIKEEPRFDYENEAPSDDEMVVSAETADEIESLQRGGCSRENENALLNSPSREDEANPHGREPSATEGQTSTTSHQINSADTTQDGFEVIGLVEPSDKIPVIEIDDD